MPPQEIVLLEKRAQDLLRLGESAAGDVFLQKAAAAECMAFRSHVGRRLREMPHRLGIAPASDVSLAVEGALRKIYRSLTTSVGTSPGTPKWLGAVRDAWFELSRLRGVVASDGATQDAQSPSQLMRSASTLASAGTKPS